MVAPGFVAVNVFKWTAGRYEPMPLDVGVPEAAQLLLQPIDCIAVTLRSLGSIPELRQSLMCVLYRSSSRRATTVRTGSEGVLVVWAESTVAKTTVLSKEPHGVLLRGHKYYFQGAGAVHNGAHGAALPARLRLSSVFREIALGDRKAQIGIGVDVDGAVSRALVLRFQRQRSSRHCQW